MPDNGSGAFTRLYDWTNDRNSGLFIDSTRMDEEFDGIATALSNRIAKDGQTAPTANLPMAGFRHTNVGNAAARSDYAAAGQVQDGGLNFGTVGGTANDITLSLTPGIAGYQAGLVIRFVAAAANTAAVTVNVNSQGAKALTKNGAAALAAGDIPSGALVEAVYDGTQFQTGIGGSPAGTVQAYAGSAAPAGWLFCDGSAVSRTTYAALFAAVGTTYGAGNGSTTFNLPDARGRVVAGRDDMGGSAAARLTSAGSGVNGAALGAAGGAQSVTLDVNKMPSHTHTATVTDPGHSHNVLYYQATGGGFAAASAVTANPVNYGTAASTTGISVTNSSTGGGEPVALVQPTLVLNFIIKT